jgi:hypothetical protein
MGIDVECVKAEIMPEVPCDKIDKNQRVSVKYVSGFMQF